MKHFYEKLGENWFTYPKLYSAVVEKFPSGSHFVEVGTWKGMSAAYMAVEIINSGNQPSSTCGGFVLLLALFFLLCLEV